MADFLGGDGLSFDRARRRGVVRRLLRRVRGRPTQLLSLEEVRGRLGLVAQADGGVRVIALDDIVGSVDRTVDFDRDFAPLAEHSVSRWRRLEEAFPDGAFPPITVYEVGGRYFVEDGHHRVALAGYRGSEFIDAHVITTQSPVGLPEDADVCDLVHLQEERRFLEHSGIGEAVPGARVLFSRPQGYAQLLEVIYAFGYARCRREGRLLPHSHMAAAFWREVYLPALTIIHREGMSDALPYKTDGDLFLHVHQRRQALACLGGQLPLEAAVRAVRDAGHPVGLLERQRLARINRRRRSVGFPRPDTVGG